MFTIQQIEQAHSKVKTGSDFPQYIREIKFLGVVAFETCVKDSHTEYFGNDDFKALSMPQYADLIIAKEPNFEKFYEYLKLHQKGETNYFEFCKHCAETGIGKWYVCLDKRTCTYYDKSGNKILVEEIPT